MKKILRVLFLFVGTVVLFSCSGSSGKEKMPFQDGLYLDYNWVQNGSEMVTRNRFIRITDGKWDFQKEVIKYKATGGEWIMNNRPGCTMFILDDTGRCLEDKGLPYKKNAGEYISFWLPIKYRRDGAVVKEFTTGIKAVVSNRQHWRKWDVWVLNVNNEEKWYYEVNTGWLVGEELVGVNATNTLIETNIIIPAIN